MTHLGKRNFLLHVLNLKKAGAFMPVLLYGFFIAPNIQNKASHDKFLRKINAQLPHQLKDLELFELVRTYQVHTHSRIY